MNNRFFKAESQVFLFLALKQNTRELFERTVIEDVFIIVRFPDIRV